MPGHNVFAVIPALNEASTIATVVRNVRTYIPHVIVVNDGSKDETFLEASKAGAIVINHHDNLGYDQSLISGFKFALQQGADIILTCDADGQHDVAYFQNFIQPIIEDSADIVVGQRPCVTRFTERIFAAYTRQRFSIRDPLCGLKAYSRKICLSVNLNKSEGFIGTYLLLKAQIKSPILIMGYIHPTSLRVKKLPFSYAVFNSEQLEVVNRYQKGCEIHIKVDTGMHRLGVMMQDLPGFIEKLRDYKNIKVSGLMSHIAYQESLKEELSKKQLINFQKANTLLKEAGFKPKWLHLAASGGILAKDAVKISKISNMARVGLGLYGIDLTGKHQELKPVLKVTSKIVQIKRLEKGDKIGYTGTFICDREMLIGVLPIGYNDGVDRNLSNKGFVIITGKPCQIVGNVSMNITTVDLSSIKNPQVGQEAIIFSDNPIHPNSIANASGIVDRIPYELLVHLSETFLKREVI